MMDGERVTVGVREKKREKEEIGERMRSEK